MKTQLILAGIIVALIGAVILAYGEFSYTSEETIFDVGPVEATAETREYVEIPGALGWIAIGAGGVLLLGGLVSGARSHPKTKERF